MAQFAQKQIAFLVNHLKQSFKGPIQAKLEFGLFRKKIGLNPPSLTRLLYNGFNCFFYWMKRIVFCLLFLIALAGCTSAPKGNQPDCNSFEIDACPAGCIVCPPCPECSNVKCLSEDFCTKTGFDKGWWNSVKPDCNFFSAESCPSDCVVCPPCEVCSSTSCQTEQFCARMGFDRNWWNSVRPDRK